MTLIEQKLYDMAAQTYQKYGYELFSDDKTGIHTCKVSEREDDIIITINPQFPEVEEFFEIMDDFEEELYEEDIEVTESRYFYNKYIIKVKKQHCRILKGVDIMNCSEFKTRLAVAQQEMIENIISDEYKKRGVYVLGKGTQVDVVFQTRIIITINSENPFLSTEFFKLIADVEERTSEAMKIFGFRHTKSEMFYGHWICTFSFTGNLD